MIFQKSHLWKSLFIKNRPNFCQLDIIIPFKKMPTFHWICSLSAKNLPSFVSQTWNSPTNITIIQILPPSFRYHLNSKKWRNIQVRKNLPSQILSSHRFFREKGPNYIELIFWFGFLFGFVEPSTRIFFVFWKVHSRHIVITYFCNLISI